MNCGENGDQTRLAHQGDVLRDAAVRSWSIERELAHIALDRRVLLQRHRLPLKAHGVFHSAAKGAKASHANIKVRFPQNFSKTS